MSPSDVFASAVSSPEPHADRHRCILRAHPEVARLLGPSPWTAPLLVALVGLQLAMSVLLRDVDAWLWWLVVCTVGVALAHAIWVLIHECSHGLGHASASVNRTLGVLGNLAHAVPAAESFRIFHMRHHKAQGRYDLDADLPSIWEVRFFQGGSLAKTSWLLFYPVLLTLRATRVARQGRVPLFTPWVLVNVISVVAFDLVWGGLFGWSAVGYLAVCFYCSLGPSYFGIRWVQEHFQLFPGQETNSYVGPLNLLMFNVGLHTEHNDFPRMAWTQLPRLRRMAPEFYPRETSLSSYSALTLRFLTDRGLTIGSRILRLSPRRPA